jgi:exonuclease SbcD
MRLLHTSDWHLGQDLHRHDRQFEHRKFLEWLLKVVEEQRIDALLIAGDVFDTANPPASAQRMFFDFLRLAHASFEHLQIVVIAGNHDSPARMEAPAELLKEFSVNVIGRVTSTPQGMESPESFLLPLCARGSKEPKAICVALPFLRTADVQWPSDATSYTDAVVRAYEQAMNHARAQYGSEIPLIAMGHMHARGGVTSEDSERKLVIGGEEAVPLAKLAKDFAYVALGHLHLAQRVAEFEHIRYSGSPIPMSFSEINYPHQVVLIELKENGNSQIDPIRVPRAVEMIRCPAASQSLEVVLSELSLLKLPNCPLSEQPFLEIPVTLKGPTPDMRIRIEEILKNIPVRLGRIVVSRESKNIGKSQQPELLGLDALRRIDPLAVFLNLHERKYSCAPVDDLLKDFSQALREVNSGGEQ